MRLRLPAAECKTPPAPSRSAPLRSCRTAYMPHSMWGRWQRSAGTCFLPLCGMLTRLCKSVLQQPLQATPPTGARVQQPHRRALTKGADAQDATELTDLWANIDSLFAGGDVHRIAAALGTMSRSAPLVAAMPGLQEMPSRLPVRTAARALVCRCATCLWMLPAWGFQCLWRSAACLLAVLQQDSERTVCCLSAPARCCHGTCCMGQYLNLCNQRRGWRTGCRAWWSRS